MDAKIGKALHGALPEKTDLKIEIVLKCDSIGSIEAVTDAISKIALPGVGIIILRSGVGAVSKSDVLLAGTSSRLIIGFQVGVMRGLEKVLGDQRVEVRLYDVIYKLIEDLRMLAERMVPAVPEEKIIGSGKIIALFKGSRKGIIIGCEVREGFLSVGERFRIISAMGPVYSGTIESLHIGEKAVRKATAGQQVGIKVEGFSKAKVGDLLESFRPPVQTKGGAAELKGGIIKK